MPAEYDDAKPIIESVTVYESEQSRATGLLDAEGRPLVRRREPIGFIRDKQEHQ